MPTLFRFLLVTGTLAAAVYAGMYVLATRFEPEARNTVYRLQDLKASGPLTAPEATTDAGGSPASEPETAGEAETPRSTSEVE